jgi:glycerol-3-phosphate O-acyltransferase / dihydroxyacetone phosphate acyltransferase
MHLFKREAGRRISWLIAEKSTKRKFIGALSRIFGAIPVGRALDKTKPAQGRIFLPDQDNDPCLIQGVGTEFKSPDFQVGGLIVLPKVRNQAPSTEIGEIISNTELRLKKPFKTPEAIKFLTGNGEQDGNEPQSRGCSFQVAPHVDQNKVYQAVTEELEADGVVGIFPEGGSHDRTDLLPLKPGVAIMALDALAENPECGVKIIPIGMNYFHAHKFRSRAVVEFGHPIEVSPEEVEAYKSGERRNAIGSLLATVHQGLVAVTQSSPDYETLMLVQAARRLYNPHGKKLPLSYVVELNRRLVKGYTAYKDRPEIIELKKDVLDYNRDIRVLGVRDHQLEWGNSEKRPWWLALGTLLYRLGELVLLSAGVLPGLILFWPVFVTTKVISHRKSKEALAASTVKLQGRDVITTWKLLVAMAVAPALYVWHGVLSCVWLVYNRRGGYYTYQVPKLVRLTTYVPDWVPVWLFAIAAFAFYIMLTFAALRIGEIGMDIVKSLPPLLVALNPRSAGSLTKLRQKRLELSARVTEIINTFGPEVYPDFDADRIVADPFRENAYQSKYQKMPGTPKVQEASEPTTPTSTGMALGDDDSITAKLAGLLPSNEAFANIGNFGFFASRPQTPRSRSRSNSGGGGLGSDGRLQGMSTLDSKGSLDEVSKRIRGAMRERGRRRETETTDAGTESSTDDGPTALTPGTEESEEAKKDR